MYYQVISQCTQSLKNLETCLDKAEPHAAAKKFDLGVLMTSRLAPDMQHFIYQVQSACADAASPRRLCPCAWRFFATKIAAHCVFAHPQRADWPERPGCKRNGKIDTPGWSSFSPRQKSGWRFTPPMKNRHSPCRPRTVSASVAFEGLGLS
jgi:hypothetical protein